MVKNILVNLFALVFGVGLFNNASADTLYLKNGRSLQGFVINESGGKLDFDVGCGTIEFKKNEIARIYKSSPKESEIIYSKWKKEKEGSKLTGIQAEAERLKRLEEWVGREVVVKQRQAPKPDPRPSIVEVDKNGGHFLVKALLNDSVQAALILDTGASMILISNKIARDLGIKPGNIVATVDLVMADGRKSKAKRVILKSVRVEDVEAKDVPAAVLLEDAGGFGLQDGLLGMSFLSRFDFKIDQENNRLIIKEAK